MSRDNWNDKIPQQSLSARRNQRHPGTRQVDRIPRQYLSGAHGQRYYSALPRNDDHTTQTTRMPTSIEAPMPRGGGYVPSNHSASMKYVGRSQAARYATENE